MATLVSTGQITIVDNNDAKPITAYITNGAQPLQQIYTKNDTVTTFTPDRSVANLVLTAKVYAGSATDIAANLTNPKWVLTPGGSAITSGSGVTVVATTGSTPTITFSDNTQVTTAAPSKTIYFEGDYVDAITGLTSHVIASTTLSLVQTGSTAVYVQFSGPSLIEQSTGATKKQIEVKADLTRSSGIDVDNLRYQWAMLIAGTWTNLDQTYSGYATKFGYRYTNQANTDNLLAPTPAMLGINVPATVAVGGTTVTTDQKAIVIDESLISSLGFFRCTISDTVEGNSYVGFFTVQDTSDPYSIQLITTSGEKLQNGIGSTDVYPIVYYGATKVVDLTSWTFNWQFWGQDLTNTVTPTCYRVAFVDTTRTAQAGGRTLGATPNTAGTSATITYGGADIAFVAGNIIKILLANGKTRFYEVASKGTNTVTIRTTAITNTWLNSATPFITTPTLNEFANGKLFVCLGSITTNGANNNDTAPKITITGDDVDVKCNIICDANRP